MWGEQNPFFVECRLWLIPSLLLVQLGKMESRNCFLQDRPEISGENTETQPKESNPAFLAETNPRHPHLSFCRWVFFLFLATVWTLGWVFWTGAVAVLPKRSCPRIACSPKYKFSSSSKPQKSSFACGAHARWKVPLWFPPNTPAAVPASPFYFSPNEIFRPHLLTEAL